MGCGETKDPRSIPRSLFLGLISLHSARSNFARVPVPLLLAAGSKVLVSTRHRVSFFFLPGWLPRSAKTRKEREWNWPALSSRSLLLSFSFLLCSRALLHPRGCRECVGLWMLSLSYLAPPSWSLCDANKGTNTSTLSKSPRELSPETPKRAYQWDRKRERKGKNVERRYLVDFAVIVNEFSRLLYKSNLDCPWNLKRLLTIYLPRYAFFIWQNIVSIFILRFMFCIFF